ncbi:phage holin family protein [Antarcticibacterium arcticum]|uniref:Phage holin family protein n=1 Tax=Antarcticibacterium arcticum TaxID=2585771 RepID=A0A5B8YNM6_9FLAO|nr:phage holin family protein [Antarcticibacterium arcticum]QED38457.1 phage holin family protein [Antarcticibacterium arcticum]
MAFEKQSNSIRELKEQISAYQHSTAEYLKLIIYKKIVKSALSLVNILLIGFVSLIALLFLSIAVAISISNALDSPSAGYYIVGGFYVLLLILFFAFGRKVLEKTVLIKSSRNFFND